MDSRIVCTGGIDQRGSPGVNDKSTFWRLVGFRQNAKSVGFLEQVPYFYQASQLLQGTYYNAGSVTEATTSSVVAMLNLVTITDFVSWNRTAGGQTACYYQSVSTPGAGSTINGHCMITVNSPAGLALTLGQALDIEIDAATTFRWRKNGGAWTAGVACAVVGTSIDAGSVTVYFLTATGFTIGDAWSWTRTDCVHENATKKSAYPLQFVTWRKQVFFVSASGRIMKVTLSTDATPVPYIISVGYRPVYGRHVNVFSEHLIVTNYSTVSTTALITASLVVAWSDKTDLDCFLSTDVNEADTYTVPVVSVGVDNDTTLLGSFTFGDLLYIVTTNIVYSTSDLGLPTVFSFIKFCNYTPGFESPFTTQYCGFSFTAEGSDLGLYVISRTRLYLFNGAFVDLSPRVVGINLSFQSVHYCPTAKEVHITTGSNTVLVYHEPSQTWFERYSGFATGGVATNGATCIKEDVTGINYGTDSRRLLRQVGSGSHVPVFDASSGTAFGTPKIITQMFVLPSLAVVKEISSVYLGVFTETYSSANYSTDADCVVNVKWYSSSAGRITGNPSTDANAVWDSSKAEQVVALPRVSFRGLALQLDLTGLSSGKPPYKVTFTELLPYLRNYGTSTNTPIK